MTRHAWSPSMLEEFRRREIVRAAREAGEARGPVVYDPPRRRKGRYPHGGNSETIMRNRVLRAQSFGTWDGGNSYDA